jgi:YesN/AraC family two-component response regulator
VDDDCKALIAQVIREARNSWENMLDTHYLQLVRRHDGVIGSEQIVRLSLEALLIGLLRSVGVGEAISGNSVIRAVRPGTQLGRKEYLEGLAKEIESWISAHLDKKITIEGLGGRFNISATSLKKLFRQRMGGGVNEYLSVKRHEAAKRFIRDGRVSMKAIAEKCGYGSVYYFSRKFSLMEGMTPSEYARSVKSKTGL